jgi:hypothetical protein
MPKPKEHPQPSPEGFDFDENEKLFSRVSDARFRELVFDTKTTIHTAKIDYNNYGEFVFITVSRLKGQGRESICFWGEGYHEPRDRWLSGEWFWHPANQFPATVKQKVSRTEVEDILSERQADIAPYAKKHEQSRRGQMFEDLAMLTDDDGAWSEMDDLGGLFGALFDDME